MPTDEGVREIAYLANGLGNNHGTVFLQFAPLEWYVDGPMASQ